MRNTTKLKLVLRKYSLCIDMDDDEHFTINLLSKDQPEGMITFQSDSYTKGIAKAYGHMKKTATGKSAGLKNVGLK